VHVVKYFIDVGQIAPHRLSAVGYGDAKPIRPNDSPVNREKNRRVEIILEMMDS
jgi:chemotaxis protein MotB